MDVVPNDKGTTLHKEIQTEQENLSKKTVTILTEDTICQIKKKMANSQIVVTSIRRDFTVLGWWPFSW